MRVNADSTKNIAQAPNFDLDLSKGKTQAPDPARVIVSIFEDDNDFGSSTRSTIGGFVSELRGRTVLTHNGGNFNDLLQAVRIQVSENNNCQPLHELRILSHGNSTGVIEAGNGARSDVFILTRELKSQGSIGTGTNVYFHGCDLAGAADGRLLLQQAADASGAIIHAWDADQKHGAPPIGKEYIFYPTRTGR